MAARVLVRTPQISARRVQGLGLEFFLSWGAYVRNEPGICSLVVLVVAASLAEAEVAVDCSTDYVCIPIVLPVILPPANLAQLQGLRHS
jgi:hypothetical protein